MNMENYPFLKEMLSTHSPSGNQVELQKKWLHYVKDFTDTAYSDVFGNAYGVINPDAQSKILLVGHGDEIGFLVKYISDEGYIYLGRSGGINPAVAVGNQVTILTKTGELKGIVGIIPEHLKEKTDVPKLEDIYVDIGAKDGESAKKHVSIGDYVVYDKSYCELIDNRIAGKALDDKTGAFIVTEVLKRLSKLSPKVGVYGVCSINEETGAGGAQFAAMAIKPDAAIALDVTFATDQPDSNPKKHGLIKMGNGPVLSIGSPIHTVINRHIETAAEKANINIQHELTPNSTGTDADPMRKFAGVPTALVSLPTRYMHSPSEVVSLEDMENEIKLLVEYIMSLDGSESYHLLDY